MKARPLTDEQKTLGALLRSPYEHAAAWLYARLAEDGFDDVRPAFSAVLRNVTAEGARVSDMAARAGMTKQSMGYLVEQMQGSGLVELAPDPNDGRAKMVTLTARGHAAMDRAMTLSAEYEEHLGRLIGAKKMAQLRSLLDEVQRAMQTQPEPAARPRRGPSPRS